MDQTDRQIDRQTDRQRDRQAATGRRKGGGGEDREGGLDAPLA